MFNVNKLNNHEIHNNKTQKIKNLINIKFNIKTVIFQKVQ